MSLIRVNLFSMSVYGGILILAVLLLRLLLKNRLPKRVFSMLWCVALLRLLIPFSVNASFGVFPVLQNQMAVLRSHSLAGGGNRLSELLWEGLYSEDIFGYYGIIGRFSDNWSAIDISGTSGGRNVERISVIPDGGNVAGVGGISDGENAVGIGGNPENGEAVGITGDLTDGGGLAFYGSKEMFLLRQIVMAGVIVCAAVFLALYLNCLRRFRTALPVEDPAVERWLGKNRLLRRVRVRRSDRISSPLTYGLIRPVILLPKIPGQEGQKLEYILQHEMVHIRRFDGAWKLAMAAALCLHWFNPLVWVMYVYMNRDLELSCDEAVLRIFGAEARKGYALTLIGMEEGRLLSVPLYSGFGKNAVEERVGEIMKYRKKTKIAVGAGAALVLAVVCMFATTSGAGGNMPEEDRELPEADVPADLPMDLLAGNIGEAELVFNIIKENMAHGESSHRLTYMLEGMPESEPARLVKGQGYQILLPEEGWTAFGPDGWMSEENNEVELWVAHFSEEGSDHEGFDREQIAESLKEQGYQESDNDRYWLYDEAGDRMTAVELHSNDVKDIWGVFYTYPGDAEDGWGVKLRAMAQTFSVVMPQPVESVPADEAADVDYGEAEEKMLELEVARWLIVRFIAASYGENHDSINQYLAEGYEVDTDILDEIKEWKQGDINVRFHPSNDHCVASIWVITTESDEDSRDFLTVELLKEGDEWKICFMGIEK